MKSSSTLCHSIAFAALLVQARCYFQVLVFLVGLILSEMASIVQPKVQAVYLEPSDSHFQISKWSSHKSCQ